jgi:hypothetical protein
MTASVGAYTEGFAAAEMERFVSLIGRTAAKVNFGVGLAGTF